MKRLIALMTTMVMLTTFFHIDFAVQAASGALPQSPELSYKSVPSGEDRSTTIIEENDIGILEKVPGNYTPAQPPFDITKGGTAVTDKTLIDVVNGFVKVGPNSAGGVTPGESTYVIKGVYRAFSATGSLGEVWDDGAGDIGDAYSSVTSRTPNAITVDSTIQIRVTQSENDVFNPVFEIFSPSTDPNLGEFTKYVPGGRATFSGKGIEGGKKYIDITFSDRNGANPITLRMYPTQKHMKYIDASGVEQIKSNDYVIKGTIFTISFLMPRSNELILKVVTPQRAVTDEAVAIQNNEKESIDTRKYILFGGANNPDWVTQNFRLRISPIKAYQKNISVEWDWEAADGSGTKPDVIEFQRVQNEIMGVNLLPRKEDTKINLIATVKYKDANGRITSIAAAPVRIPMIIKGTGVPPYLRPNNASYGVNNGVDDPTTRQVSINVLPTRMDAYNGNVKNYPLVPGDPFEFDMQMFLGEGNATADYAIITASDPEALNLYIANAPYVYKYGDKITATDNVNVIVRAKKPGKTTLTFDFYVKDAMGKPVKYDGSITHEITVADSTPKQNADLSALVLTPVAKSGQDLGDYKTIPIDFKPGVYDYTVDVPFKVGQFKFRATVNTEDANRQLDFTIDNVVHGDSPITSGTVSTEIVLLDGKTTELRITVTGQNPNIKKTYVIKLRKMPQSGDATLKSLGIYDARDKNAPNILPAFDPQKLEYNIEVPYSFKQARVDAQTNNDWAQTITTNPPLRAPTSLFSLGLGTRNILDLGYGDESPAMPNPTVLTISIKAENGAETTYTVRIKRLPPSENNMLSALEVKDADKNPIAFDNGQKFDKGFKAYQISVPYSTKKLFIAAAPDDALATELKVSTKRPAWNNTQDLTTGLPVKDVEVDVSVGNIPESNFEIQVEAKAENGVYTTPPYILYVTRMPPNNDTTVSSIEVADQDGKAVDTFAFNPETLEYTVAVPYETERVRITPKAKATTTTLAVEGVPITANKPTYTENLEASKTKTIKVVATAEDGSTKTYTIKFTRGLPAKEARLKALAVSNTTDFKPGRFVPSTYKYTAKVNDGAAGVAVTATTVHPGATITVNGKKATSGVATDLIELYNVKETITIVVTAQDGKTKITYKVDLTNMNMVQLTNNADLRRLTIPEGEMSPKFVSSTEDYEVAVKGETTNITIDPLTADPYATVRVLMGTKELGDYNGNYSHAISEDGETVFTIEVTSSDKKKIKKYTVAVFRNEEGKEGVLRPIDAKSINFESPSPIIVDITKYSVIQGDVFNKLKEYPDTTIVFQGNDYSLAFKGSDIATLVPHTNIYDLGLSFTSPEESDIYYEMGTYDSNYSIEPVMVYFKHHGALPGKAKLTMSLGTKYANKTYYWNYYNTERERIDYYGFFKTNSRGTFTLMMDHFSTYFITTKIVKGAENKSNAAAGGNVSAGLPNKENPNTGTERS